LKAFKEIKCLIVDDDEGDFFLAEDALSDISVRPHLADWAPTYEQAEVMLAGKDYNVCLVDYRIGPKNGLTFVRRMIARGCRVPMILLTGMSDPEIDEEAADAGAFDFINKGSITPETLERSIRYSVLLSRQLRRLEDNSVLLRVTLEHTGAGIAAFDSGNKLETYNNRLLEILDLQEDANDVGDDGATAETHERLRRKIVRRLQLFGQNAEIDTEIEFADGRIIEVCINSAPDNRKIIVCSDITERKKAEEDLIRSREAAVEADESKSRFLANMSHELRTPLNAIIGFSELMKIQMAQHSANPQWIEYADDVHSSGTHLLAVINDILEISKIDAGKVTLTPDWSDIGELVEFCQKSVATQARARGQRLGYRINTTLETVRCDRRLMRQALINLLSNAVKFTPDGGMVRTSVDANPDGSISFSVVDNGIGMTTKEIDICMKPFGQADSSLARRFDGTGLGLPLVQRYTELHGGRLEIQSVKNKGTTATITLPAECAAGDTSLTPATTAA
jgi:signal transduction histidine kinase